MHLDMDDEIEEVELVAPNNQYWQLTGQEPTAYLIVEDGYKLNITVIATNVVFLSVTRKEGGQDD